MCILRGVAPERRRVDRRDGGRGVHRVDVASRAILRRPWRWVEVLDGLGNLDEFSFARNRTGVDAVGAAAKGFV